MFGARALKSLCPAAAAASLFVAASGMGSMGATPMIDTHCAAAERVPVSMKIDAMQERLTQMEAAMAAQKQEPKIDFGKYHQRYTGKYCLVTGGSKGIGRGICLRLAQEGAHVAIHYGRDKKGAEVTQQMINEELDKMGFSTEEIKERTMIVGANASS